MVYIVDKEHERDFFLLWKTLWPLTVHLSDKIKIIYAGAATNKVSIKQRSPENIIKEINHFYNLGKRIFVFDCLTEAILLSDVQRMCNLPESELINFTNFAKNIVEYNHQVFVNRTDFTKIADIRSILNIQDL